MSAQSKINRQGRGDLITGKQADEVLNILKDDATRTYDNYEKISMKDLTEQLLMIKNLV